MDNCIFPVEVLLYIYEYCNEETILVLLRLNSYSEYICKKILKDRVDDAVKNLYSYDTINNLVKYNRFLTIINILKNLEATNYTKLIYSRIIGSSIIHSTDNIIIIMKYFTKKNNIKINEYSYIYAYLHIQDYRFFAPLNKNIISHPILLRKTIKRFFKRVTSLNRLKIFTDEDFIIRLLARSYCYIEILKIQYGGYYIVTDVIVSLISKIKNTHRAINIFERFCNLYKNFLFKKFHTRDIEDCDNIDIINYLTKNAICCDRDADHKILYKDYISKCPFI